MCNWVTMLYSGKLTQHCKSAIMEKIKIIIKKKKKLEENIVKTFSDIKHTNVFLGQSLKAIEIKTKIKQWDLIKLTSSCTTKEIIKKPKRQPMEWEKIVADDATDKGLISKIYKQLNSKPTNQPTQLKNGQKT